MNPKGSDRVIIVDGEAPESSSDEEIESFDIPVSPAREVSESIGSSQATNQSLGNEFPSAYHKKLYLKNEDLWNRLSGLLSKTIETSSKNLIATDQLLLKCQITLQSVSKSTKKVNSDMDNITSNLRDLLAANFLPPIHCSLDPIPAHRK